MFLTMPYADHQTTRLSGARGRVVKRTSFGVGLDVANESSQHGSAGLVRDRGRMRLQHHVVECEKARVEVRLACEHIEGSAGDLSLLQRGDQCGLVNDRSARDIDQVSVWSK